MADGASRRREPLPVSGNVGNQGPEDLSRCDNVREKALRTRKTARDSNAPARLLTFVYATGFITYAHHIAQRSKVFLGKAAANAYLCTKSPLPDLKNTPSRTLQTLFKSPMLLESTRFGGCSLIQFGRPGRKLTGTLSPGSSRRPKLHRETRVTSPLPTRQGPPRICAASSVRFGPL